MKTSPAFQAEKWRSDPLARWHPHFYYPLTRYNEEGMRHNKPFSHNQGFDVLSQTLLLTKDRRLLSISGWRQHLGQIISPCAARLDSHLPICLPLLLSFTAGQKLHCHVLRMSTLRSEWGFDFWQSLVKQDKQFSKMHVLYMTRKCNIAARSMSSCFFFYIFYNSTELASPPSFLFYVSNGNSCKNTVLQTKMWHLNILEDTMDRFHSLLKIYPLKRLVQCLNNKSLENEVSMFSYYFNNHQSLYSWQLDTAAVLFRQNLSFIRSTNSIHYLERFIDSCKFYVTGSANGF